MVNRRRRRSGAAAFTTVAQMPAAPGLGDTALLGEGRHDAIQVVLLDPHRLRELRDGDARTLRDELERLLRAGAGAARPSATAGPATAPATATRTARAP